MDQPARSNEDRLQPAQNHMHLPSLQPRHHADPVSNSVVEMFPSISRDHFNTTTSSPQSLASSPPATSPASPRSGRLRGLNYLRSYTQTHLLSRDSREGRESQSNSPIVTSLGSPTRSTSVSSPQTIVAHRTSSPPTPRAILETPSTALAESTGSTSGWLPTVNGHSVAARLATEPQSTVTDSPSALLASSSASMARTRSSLAAGSLGAVESPSVDPIEDAGALVVEAVEGSAGGMSHQLPSIRFSAHQDPRAQRPSLIFSPMGRILPTGREVIKVGRYSERDNVAPHAPNIPSAAPVGFKSKVVSRRHCEFWCSKGRWYIKDVSSSSGTFLNHVRLSGPGAESKAFPINDGDIVQLGIDFKGGEEMIFRCVKIRVELNKGWQNGPSSFK